MTALPGQTHTRLRVGVPDPGEPRAVLGVVARPAVMASYCGCGLMPSGACHPERPITLGRRGIDAPLLLREQSR